MQLLSAIVGALILYLIQRNLYNKYWNRKLSVEVAFSKDYAVEGEDMTLKETIVNNKLLPIPILKLKFMTSKNLDFTDTINASVSDNYYRNDMVSILMYQKLTRTLSFHCKRRGYYKIDRIEIIGSNLFLSNENVACYDMNTDLYVFPRNLEHVILESAFQKMLGTVLTKRFINEDPFEFRNIREYQSFDNLKSVNWKASAKSNTMMVNVHDYTSSQQVRIFLNTESQTLYNYENLKEESIQIAATLALAFLGQGIPVSFGTNAKDVITAQILKVPSGSGESQIRNIQESLARIDLNQEPESFVAMFQDEFENSTASDYVILISSYQKDDLQELLLSHMHNNKEFVWIVPVNSEIKVLVNNDLIEKIVPIEFN